jgi:hypothetical protein
VGTEAEARALAAVLNGNEGSRPVVVVSTPATRHDPYIDTEDIAAQLGELAEVYVIPTGLCTWEFSKHMPDRTQVYGGAGRVYPGGHEWVNDPYKSPLRFAFQPGRRRSSHDRTDR